MTLDVRHRFSVFIAIVSAGFPLAAIGMPGDRARAADAGTATQIAIEAPRIFKLTVLSPDGRVLPRVPVEMHCEPTINAAQVREGKFLRSQSNGALVESSANGRVTVELPRDVENCSYGVELPGFGPCWCHSKTWPGVWRWVKRLPARLRAGWLA